MHFKLFLHQKTSNLISNRCIFFDKLFLTLRVLLLLQVIRNIALTTFCFTHITRWSLASEKDLKKTWSVTSEFLFTYVKMVRKRQQRFHFRIQLRQWELYPRKKYWDPKKKDVTYLDSFKEYNGKMGEIDPNDVLAFHNYSIF